MASRLLRGTHAFMLQALFPFMNINKEDSPDITRYKAKTDPNLTLWSHEQDKSAATFPARHPQSEGAYLTPFRLV